MRRPSGRSHKDTSLDPTKVKQIKIELVFCVVPFEGFKV
jgi:hypothetical protein